MASIVIHIKNNGPYRISVEEAPLVEIRDADGTVLTPAPGRPIALCRCGGSLTKPFCDASHKANGFDGTCARQTSAHPETRDPSSSA